MVHVLRINESRSINAQGSHVLHRAIDGRLYVGPPIFAESGDKILVEASARPGPNGYYRIDKVLRIIPETERIA